jgi:itaconyl-CoA hydratase
MDPSLQELIGTRIRLRGHTFDDFEIGMVFDHHWGRTIETADNLQFSLATLQCNPSFLRGSANG